MTNIDIDDITAKEICRRYWPFDAWLAKDTLIIGERYLCRARNFYLGEWTGKGFKYMRYKFGQTFEDIEYHWDDGPPYGTVKPLQVL